MRKADVYFRIEKKRTVIPALAEALKGRNSGDINVDYFYKLLFTRENLKLVHIVCHKKGAHELSCDSQKIYKRVRRTVKWKNIHNPIFSELFIRLLLGYIVRQVWAFLIVTHFSLIQMFVPKQHLCLNDVNELIQGFIKVTDFIFVHLHFYWFI